MEILGYTESGMIRVVFDGESNVSTVPNDMRNRHRQMIAEWEAEGNTIPPYEEPEIPLAPITARQLRLGLVMNGIALSQVDSAIAAIEDSTERELAGIEWKYASDFRRDHPLLIQVGTGLGLTEQQMNDMWLAAAQL